jgi:hypothetical protein
VISAQCPSTALGPPSAQSPFAAGRCYRHAGDVQRLLVGHYSHFIAPTGSCARPVALPPASAMASHRRSLQVAVSPLLGPGPSRRYLCQSFPACLDPYSGCSQGARTRYFPQDIGLPRKWSGSARGGSPTATSVGTTFRSCSHLLMFRPTGLLATPVAPTSRLSALGSRGFYIRAYQSSLPHSAADMLSVQNRAIDGRRTFTSQDWQPCRLLPIRRSKRACTERRARARARHSNGRSDAPADRLS